MENWKPIIGFEGMYEVSNLGGVRSLDRVELFKDSSRRRKGKYFTPRVFNGYYTVALQRIYTRFVHRLVAEAFVEGKGDGSVVNHKDCNRLNNNADNLEWVTQKQNIAHAVSLSRHPHGETHGNSVLNESDVKYIKSQTLGGIGLARQFGVSYSTIKRIRNNRAWKHVA
jgi:hypothetical protein